MMSTNPENLAGVGAFIVSPNKRVLVVIEQTTSERTVKERGMWTHPMESIEPNESPEEALVRIFREEIRLPRGKYKNLIAVGALCDVRITNGINVRMFGFKSPDEFTASVGTTTQEVSFPKWVVLDLILQEQLGTPRFRPGVRETAKAYLHSQLVEQGNFTKLVYEEAEDERFVKKRLEDTRLFWERLKEPKDDDPVARVYDRVSYEFARLTHAIAHNQAQELVGIDREGYARLQQEIQAGWYLQNLGVLMDLNLEIKPRRTIL